MTCALGSILSVSDLRIAQRQMLEILKLLWRNAKVLILDEPTSQLAPHEIDDVLRVARRLAGVGRTVFLVTHKIDEVLRFADRVTVLRAGEAIATLAARDLSREELGGLIIGPLQPGSSGEANPGPTAEPVLSLRSASLTANLDRHAYFDLDVFRGEILGIAGVSRDGPEDLADLLVAAERTSSVGCAGIIAYIPPDPRRTGSIATLPLSRSVFLREFDNDRIRRGPFVRMAALRRETAVSH